MMKRLEGVVPESENIGLSDLPNDIKALVLLHYVNFKLDSVRKWHRIQKLFRSIPLFGLPEVKLAFYRKIYRIKPDLFSIFYKTMEYPPFLGLVEFQASKETKEPHIEMLPQMANLTKLDISQFQSRVEIDELTNLTFYSGNYFTKDEDLLKLPKLIGLSGREMRITNNSLAKLTKLEELSLGPLCFHDRHFSVDVFQELTNLKKLCLEDAHQELFDRLGEIGLFTKNMVNLTSLEFGGNLTIAATMFPNIPNLKKLHVNLFTSDTNGHFSCLVNLEQISIGGYCRYEFNGDDLKSLSKLDTILFNGEGYLYRELLKLTTLTHLSISSELTTVGDFSEISRLSGVKILEFGVIRCPCDSVLSKLENLTHLNLIGNRTASDRCLLKLTNLTRLDFALGANFSRNALNQLPKLCKFGVPKVDYAYLERKLRSLDRPDIKLFKI